MSGINLSNLSPERRAAVEKLLASAAATRPNGPAPRATSGPAPLSLGQETLWLTDRVLPGAATYNVPLALQILGELNADALLGAVRNIVRRHRGLQMYVSAEGDDYYQTFSLDTQEVEQVKVTDSSAAIALLRRESGRGFDLTHPPLWRMLLASVSEREHYFLFNVHHIVFDGWSSGIFFNELRTEYASLSRGEAADLAEPPLQYDDFSEWQREQVAEGRMDDDLRYWKDYLDDLTVLDLATDRPLPPEVTFNGHNTSLRLPGVTSRVNELARSLDVTTYALYSALIATVLDRYAQNDEIVFAIPAANRSYESLERIIGFFVNVLPIRCATGNATTFGELAQQCHGDIREAAARSQVPFESIVAAVKPKRDPSRQPLFQVGMAVQEQGWTPELDGLDVTTLDLSSATARYQLSFVVAPDGPDATVHVEYNTDIFDEETILSMIRCVGQAARTASEDPTTKVRLLPLLDVESERAEQQRGVGDVRELRKDTVPDAFSVRVGQAPDAVAAIDTATQVTYKKLEERARTIATAIAGELDQPNGTRIAVLTERTVDLPATVLAIMSLGAVYVPIDPSNPELRVREILDDSGAVLVVGHEALLAPFRDRRVIALETLTSDRVRDDLSTLAVINPGDPAYIMYTSGSTGAAKGVIISHSNVVNFIQNTIDLFELTAEDRVLGYASIGFDVSIFEMFAALLTGASVHFVPTEKRLDMDFVQGFIAEHEITVTDLPPSVMSLLDPERFDALRIVFVGGEPFSSELVDRWAPGRRFFNGYGPTECTVTMIVHECTPGTYATTPPIGLPMTNHVAHVIDERGRVAAPGVIGELVVGGSGLAIGYHNRPEADEQAFIPDRFGTSPDHRLYRSGDLVRRDAHGDLVYVGRRDSQVKVNGVRVEPGEVEWALRSANGVGQAHAQVVDLSTGRALVAYYTTKVNTPVSEESLREHLKKRLVPAMVPRFLIAMDALPLNASGKVDHRRLPDPTSESNAEYRAFRPGMEEEIWIEIYRPILGIDEMGPKEDFFEVGGASLQAAQVISRIRKRYEVELPLSKFFMDSSIAAVALHVERAQLSQLSEQEIAVRLENMNDEDVERLLAAED